MVLLVAWAVLSGGSFLLGSKVGAADEGPAREVTVAPFELATTAVTRGEWAQFVAATGYESTAQAEGGGFGLTAWGAFGYFKDLTWETPGFDQTDDHPVVVISWFDAVAYCNWKSVQEGLTPCYLVRGTTDWEAWPRGWNQRRTLVVTQEALANGYRLPTEAEWEWAATAKGQQTYPWGNGPPWSDRPLANLGDAQLARRFEKAETWLGLDDGFLYSAPVGSFAADVWGLYDMAGNVQQWCDDVAPPGSRRVIKGSSWKAVPDLARASARGSAFPEERSSLVGFRLARNHR
jgi:formylglycine-generating enzyme required for sulfatase activity